MQRNAREYVGFDRACDGAGFCRLGGWVDGWMGGWVDGWMGGWVDGWMAMWLARPQGEGEKSYLSVCWEAVSPEMWKCV
jgi:hypothetical protein